MVDKVEDDSDDVKRFTTQLLQRVASTIKFTILKRVNLLTGFYMFPYVVSYFKRVAGMFFDRES